MKFLLLLLLAVSCFDKADSPETALKQFVSSRLDKVVSREDVLERTTGKLKKTVETMSPEEFKRFADLTDYKPETFKVINKSCQDKKCFVTYTLGYRTAPEGKTEWTSEVKKVVEMHFDGGKWLIADVSNIKTYHESTETIEVTP